MTKGQCFFYHHPLILFSLLPLYVGGFTCIKSLLSWPVDLFFRLQSTLSCAGPVAECRHQVARVIVEQRRRLYGYLMSQRQFILVKFPFAQTSRVKYSLSSSRSCSFFLKQRKKFKKFYCHKRIRSPIYLLPSR